LSTRPKQRGEVTGKGFLPGQSGNPGGMKKDVAHARELARAHTATAVQTLVDLLRARSEAVRVAAAQALLDRGWGRPLAMVSGPDGGPIEHGVHFYLPHNGRDALVAECVTLPEDPTEPVTALAALGDQGQESVLISPRPI
jgi:HEAT repeat protein